jgi:MFS family permease
MLNLVAAVTILVHLAFAGARFTLSLFALSMQATPLTVGLLLSVLALVPMVFVVTWGRYIDRVGVRGPILVGVAALFAALLLAYAVPQLWMLFIVSALAGSGFIVFHISVNQAAGLIGEPEDRAKNFAVLALAFSIANFLGPVLAGFAIDWLGYRNTFLILSSAALAALVLLMVKRVEVPRHATAFKPGERKRISDLLRIPLLRRVFVVSALLSMAWDLFSFVVPIHGSSLGLSASTIGIILGCFGGAVFFVRLFLPAIVHRLSEWPLLVGAMIATGAGLAVMPLVEQVPLLMVLAFLLGCGLGGTQPIVMALLYDTAPAGRGGEAVGVRTLLLNSSQAGIPLLFGALGAALGMAPVFWTMALSLIAGAWYARPRS